jgi:hypothetical protein
MSKSLPLWEELNNPNSGALVQALRTAVQNYGIEAFEPGDVPGLEAAYKNRLLHATSTVET